MKISRIIVWFLRLLPVTPWSVKHTLFIVNRYLYHSDEVKVHTSHALNIIREGARIGNDTVYFDTLHQGAIFALRDLGFVVSQPDPLNPGEKNMRVSVTTIMID